MTYFLNGTDKYRSNALEEKCRELGYFSRRRYFKFTSDITMVMNTSNVIWDESTARMTDKVCTIF
jgi:hypothetical protein